MIRSACNLARIAPPPDEDPVVDRCVLRAGLRDLRARGAAPAGRL